MTCPNEVSGTVIVQPGGTPVHVTIVDQNCVAIATSNLSVSANTTAITVQADSSGMGYNLSAAAGHPNQNGIQITFTYNGGGAVPAFILNAQVGDTVSSLSATSP